MKTTGKIWIIFDAKTRKQSKPLSTLQAQAAILNLAEKLDQQKRFFIWTPGWNEWKSLKSFMDSEQTYFVIAPNLQTPPETTVTEIIADEVTVKAQHGEEKPYTEIEQSSSEHEKNKTDYGYFYEDFKAEQIDLEAKPKMRVGRAGQKGRERRVDTRHQFKLEVILINKSGRSFKTFSQNISMGGTLLEDELPKEFVRSQFDLILINNFQKDPHRGRVHFQGRVVGDFVNPRRLMFTEMDEHTRKKLAQMIQDYAESQSHFTNRTKAE